MGNFPDFSSKTSNHLKSPYFAVAHSNLHISFGVITEHDI